MWVIFLQLAVYVKHIWSCILYTITTVTVAILGFKSSFACITCLSYCPLTRLHEWSSACSSLMVHRSIELSPSFTLAQHSTTHNSSLITADICFRGLASFTNLLNYSSPMCHLVIIHKHSTKYSKDKGRMSLV